MYSVFGFHLIKFSWTDFAAKPTDLKPHNNTGMQYISGILYENEKLPN